MRIETYVWRYPAAELWETCSWFAKINFIYDEDNHWTATDKMFKDKKEAEMRAIQLAIWLEGAFVGQKGV